MQRTAGPPASPGSPVPTGPGTGLGWAPGAGPEGSINPERVTAWFVDHIPDVTPPLRFLLIAGGRSNLTFSVDDDEGRSWVLRRPPVSHVLPTAHDMSREYRIMSALGPTPVPVPVTYGLCEDESVNGRPFYVMELVDGHILREPAAAQSDFSEAQRHAIGGHLADTLATLHAVDVDAVGLGTLGRREGYVERQIRRWSEQYRTMAVAGVDHGDLVERVGAELAARIPAQRETTIVHGDYRLDNTVLDDNGRVKAILDWEICTLGDPMADVGLLMVYWPRPGDDDPFLGGLANTAPGFATRQEVLEAYARSSGRDLADIAYFTAFGYWKLACILQGVYARYVAGASAGDQTSVDDYPLTVRHLAGRAAEALAAR